MSHYKYSKCANEIVNEIYENSIENKIFWLGYSEGLVLMYKMVEKLLDNKEKEIIVDGIKSMDKDNYIHRLLEAYDSENSKADNLAEAFEDYKQSTKA